MTIRHHLDEATLISYAGGASCQAMALVVACHLSVCQHCRNRLQQAEIIGGALLDKLTPAPVSDDALQAVLARLDQPQQKKASVTAVRSQCDIPAPLRDYIGDSLDVLKWKKLAPGIECHELACHGEGQSKLLKIAPGKALLPHGHKGNELTFVLRGSFCDDVGRFKAGDIADLDDQIEHQPLVDGNEQCICLIATDAPLRFTTFLGRLMQPIMGF